MYVNRPADDAPAQEPLPADEVSPPPSCSVEHRASEYARLIDDSFGIPYQRRAWSQLSRTEQDRLRTLEYTPKSWDAVQRGDLKALPPAAQRIFAVLPKKQQEAIRELGLTPVMWDMELGLRSALLACPHILQRFSALIRNNALIHADGAQRLVQAARANGLETPQEKRALLYVLNFHGRNFSEEARMILRTDINRQTRLDQIAHKLHYGSTGNLGWNASVVPQSSSKSRIEEPPVVNDASGGQATIVREIAHPKSGKDICNIVKRARAWRDAGVPVRISIAGRRHSMGGQSAAAGSINIDMTGVNRIRVSSDRKTVRVGAGATWAQVLNVVAPLGKTPQTMQDYDVFTVGGSLSVNVHGRTPNLPPFVSTVRSFRMVNAEGKLITCSRDENKELFRHVIGGYGLFGVVVDVDLDLTDNPTSTFEAEVVSEKDFPKAFDAAIKDPHVELAWGRLSPTFHGDVILHTVRRGGDGKSKGFDYERAGPLMRLIEKVAIKASGMSWALLEARWWLEKKLRQEPTSGSRAEFLGLNPDGLRQLAIQEGREAGILQEYFIPRANAQRFIDGMERLRAKMKLPMTATTIRDVPKDVETALPFAKKDSYAFVLYDVQPLTHEGYEKAGLLTRAFIDLALECGGTFYLPYQKHYTRAQLVRAYPEIDAFFATKLKYDPDETFAHPWYDMYGPNGPRGKAASTHSPSP